MKPEGGCAVMVVCANCGKEIWKRYINGKDRWTHKTRVNCYDSTVAEPVEEKG